ncbi:hypothetical protein HB662_24570 [Roseomonas frigidaquae]|uniref:Uncharacterized protein n=1 Tax=Falsiroseomonas frigidaquae TaxID=487318 RepID=A0ABX1F6G3_9PROT|nr:hypothetical protein [Falsiroseomonas frigidaquae]NKE47975.1 hypothetical protein [Falsiroseomonas frigidaquae]
MFPTQRVTAGLFQRMRFGPSPLIAAQPAPATAPANMRLFRVVTIRGDLVLGLSPAELATLGPGPDLDRLARRIATDGQISGWLYREARGPDGGGRLQTERRVAVQGQDALTLQPHSAAMPVQPPPTAG